MTIKPLFSKEKILAQLNEKVLDISDGFAADPNILGHHHAFETYMRHVEKFKVKNIDWAEAHLEEYKVLKSNFSRLLRSAKSIVEKEDMAQELNAADDEIGKLKKQRDAFVEVYNLSRDVIIEAFKERDEMLKKIGWFKDGYVSVRGTKS